MNTENENSRFESNKPDLENGSLRISEETIRNVLSLYGNPESFGTDRKFGGWTWWELINLIEDPTKASQKRISSCPPAVAKLFTELPGVRGQLEEMRRAAVTRMQSSIKTRLLELTNKWTNGAQEDRGGTSYRVLDAYADDKSTTNWLAFLNGTLPNEKLYEMGIYIFDLPGKDLTVVNAFAVDRLKEVSAETVQGWMRMPCVVITGVESRYYPSGLENPSNCNRVPNAPVRTESYGKHSGAWYDAHGNLHSGYSSDTGGRH